MLGRARKSQNFLLAPVFQLFEAATQYQSVLLRGVFPSQPFLFVLGVVALPCPLARGFIRHAVEGQPSTVENYLARATLVVDTIAL